MADEEVPEEEEKKKRSKKTLIIPIVVLLIGVGVGGFFFMNGKSKKAEGEHGTTTTTVAHGQTVRLKPLTLNLTDGHVLKVGIALQLVEKPKDKHLAAALGGGGHGGGATTEVPDSPLHGVEAKALDQAIQTLGDSTFEELSKPGGKLHAKEELSHKIVEIYHGDVVEVYFTDFVMS